MFLKLPNDSQKSPMWLSKSIDKPNIEAIETG